jgi:hypothetical protein
MNETNERQNSIDAGRSARQKNLSEPTAMPMDRERSRDKPTSWPALSGRWSDGIACQNSTCLTVGFV